jgi:hypothetical protein
MFNDLRESQVSIISISHTILTPPPTPPHPTPRPYPPGSPPLNPQSGGIPPQNGPSEPQFSWEGPSRPLTTLDDPPALSLSVSPIQRKGLKGLANGCALTSQLMQGAMERLSSRGITEHEPAAVAAVIRLMLPHLPASNRPSPCKLALTHTFASPAAPGAGLPVGRGEGLLGPMTKAERGVWEEHVKMLSAVSSASNSAVASARRSASKSAADKRREEEEEEEEGEVDEGEEEDGYGMGMGSRNKDVGATTTAKAAGGGRSGRGGRGGRAGGADRHGRPREQERTDEEEDAAAAKVAAKWHRRLKGLALSVNLSIANRQDAPAVSTQTLRPVPLAVLSPRCSFASRLVRTGKGGDEDEDEDEEGGRRGEEEEGEERDVVGCRAVAGGFSGVGARGLGTLTMAGELQRPITLAGNAKLEIQISTPHPLQPIVLDCLTPKVTPTEGRRGVVA